MRPAPVDLLSSSPEEAVSMSNNQRRVPRYARQEEDRQKAQKEAEEARRRHWIAADVSQQSSPNAYDARTYYEDIEFSCSDCGRREVWTSGQQKWWYEVAKGHIDSTAIRCRACRRALRQAHGGTPRRSHAERKQAEGD